MNLPSAVKLTVLGCAGSSFDESLRIPCSSYLIESDEAAILLDCGFGSFESYSTLSPDTRLDAIFVSHAHADHSEDVELFMGSKSAWRDQPRLVATKHTLAFIVKDPGPFLMVS
jgi:ribonuclease BN (tRNA processing enzyme)